MDALVEAFIRQLPSWTAGGVAAVAWFLWRLWLRVHDHINKVERDLERVGERIERALADQRQKAEVEALRAEHRCDMRCQRLDEMQADLEKLTERLEVLEKRRRS